MKPLFIAKTLEGKEIIGNTDISNPGWQYIMDDIKEVSFLLPNNEYFEMKDYDKYLYGIEVVMDLNGINKGNLRIEKIHYFGKKGNIVDEFIADINTNKINKLVHNWEDIKNKYRGWK